MRILRAIIATSASLAAYAVLHADTGSSDNSYGRQWMDHYYQNPRPNDFLRAVYSLNRDGYFDTDTQPNTAIGFFATVFKQNPEQADQWLRASATLLPDRGRRILAVAAWLAGNPTGTKQVETMSSCDSSDVRDGVARLVSKAPPSSVSEIPVDSEPSMNIQWGAYLASGDRRNITNVLAALGSNEPGLATSARFALAQDASADPRVLEICRAELSRQPEPMRAEFEAAVSEVKMGKPSS
jgi:hypothetical protein